MKLSFIPEGKYYTNVIAIYGGFELKEIIKNVGGKWDAENKKWEIRIEKAADFIVMLEDYLQSRNKNAEQIIKNIKDRYALFIRNMADELSGYTILVNTQNTNEYKTLYNETVYTTHFAYVKPSLSRFIFSEILKANTVLESPKFIEHFSNFNKDDFFIKKIVYRQNQERLSLKVV